MATMPNPGLLHVRPSLTRSRSNTSPNTPSNLSIETSALSPDSPQRPGHNRSKSYVSPPKTKPSPFDIPPTPTEKSQESSRFPRLLLPGRNTHAQNDDAKVPLHRRHRFIQSESQQYHKRNDLLSVQEAPSTLSNKQKASTTDTSSPTSRGAAIPSLMRMRSYRTYRGPNPMEEGNIIDGNGKSRGRANSDPKSPTQLNESSSPQNPVEAQLRRGDLLRYAAHQNATEEDINRMNTKLKEAKAELAARLNNNKTTASELMQRLDQAHDTLHRTAESLVDTLSSFSSLAQQSEKLLSNFDTETTNLDSSLRQRIQRFSNEITTRRADRVTKLERRGQTVSQKASDLSRRLENCRTIVQNWEARELKKRKTWKGVRDGILWSLMLILLGVSMGILSWRAVQFSDGKGTPEATLGDLLTNESWAPESPASAHVPEDVRVLLHDIAARDKDRDRIRNQNVDDDATRTKRKPGLRGGSRSSRRSEPDRDHVNVDRRVRLLDEL